VKEKMYRYAPAILLSGGLVLWVITLLIHRYCLSAQALVWTSFIVTELAINVVCGIIINKLHQQVHIDVLTGLYNRKYLYTKLPELQTKIPVSLILIDIDNFKIINDTYGHVAGDQVLQQFAQILQSNTRKKDIVARWGGEEFVILLCQTDGEEAFRIADRIRKAVENDIFSYNGIACKITVSMGVASTQERISIDLEQFLKTADAALYRAKEKKNFIVTILLTNNQSMFNGEAALAGKDCWKEEKRSQTASGPV